MAGSAQLPEPSGEALYLEVVLNRAPIRQIRQFWLRGQAFYAEAQTLRALGLTWPGAQEASGQVALDSLPDLKIEYQEAEQRLLLMAPVSLLGRPASALGYRPPPAPELDPATRAPGLLLNYDVYTQGERAYRSASAWHESRVFGVGPGVFSSSGVLQGIDSDAGGSQRRSTRLDTAWQLDFPESMVSATLGDTYTSGLPWTRSTRFGGLRVARNFSLQPYRVTVPLAGFAGEAALPSTVDLFINGIRQMRGEVDPGRFELASAPVLNGVGQAQVVITDITGQRRVVDFSLYNNARMLQQGLSDWSVEAGYIRRDYGLRSNAYAPQPMLSASGRYGLNNSLTLETHGEGGGGLSMGGLGALWLLGRTGGVLSAAYAASRSDTVPGRMGQQGRLGYEWQGRRFNASMATLRRDAAFRDTASLEGSELARRTDQVYLGVSMGRSQFGVSYIRQDRADSSQLRYASLSLSWALESYGSVSLSVNRDLNLGGGNNAYFYWSMPLGDRRHGWASSQHRTRGSSSSVGAMQSLPGDQDGWGWRLRASTGVDAGSEASVNQINRFGQWRAGLLHWHGHQGDDRSLSFAGASGGLLLMQGQVFPMRRVYDAFALVSTDGIADVPVLLENRRVGVTDGQGLLLVTPLNAWQSNDLAIDPLVLPDDVSVRSVRVPAVPATGSGMLVRFPMRAVLVVEAALRGPSGDWLPPGTPVSLEPHAQQATVGYDGRLYLEAPQAGARLSAQWDGKACSVVLPATLPERGRMDLGELVCQAQASD